MKILTIVGARPQFIKAAAVSRALGAERRFAESILHTGQHFDDNMSAVFFEELGIPAPDHHLGIHGESHGAMTGRMLGAIEAVMLEHRPDLVLVYGDTNSTLAGALAAAKLNLPLAHVEAGLRSFNRRMPEEINRVVTDHVSTLLFCPTATAVSNLRREGVDSGVHLVGDVMFDAALHFAAVARRQSRILDTLGLAGGRRFAVATFHRAENTDDAGRLEVIVRGLSSIANELPVVLPLHPRTRAALVSRDLLSRLGRVTVTEPLSFLDMIRLTSEAKLVLTDSGGLQKEAYFFQVPCVTLRPETEWVETVQCGWNRLAGDDVESIVGAALSADRPAEHPTLFGDGAAAETICRVLLEFH